jgi:glycosyltransferase involved in cell wall biosynthesis
MDNAISVVIPTHNRAGVLPRAVQSALAAVAPGDEVIVVDDGSTDSTAEALKAFSDKIRYFYQANAGPGPARNRGIQLANNPLIAFLDSDDEWFPDKLYLQRAVMDKFPHLVFCFTNLLAKCANGEIVHNIIDFWRCDEKVGYRHAHTSLAELLGTGLTFSSIAPLPPGRADFDVHTGGLYASLMESYSAWTCSIVVRRKLAGNSFYFTNERLCEDWECFARLAKAGTAAYLNCEAAAQHVHTDARLTDASDIEHATARIKLLTQVWGRDERFLERYSHRYQGVLKAQHLRRAKHLLNDGRVVDAKEDLKVAGSRYRLLATLPSAMIRACIEARRGLRGALTKKSGSHSSVGV